MRGWVPGFGGLLLVFNAVFVTSSVSPAAAQIPAGTFIAPVSGGMAAPMPMNVAPMGSGPSFFESTKQCASLLVGGEPPTIGGFFAQGQQFPDCAGGYFALSSSITKGPLWVAEHLTASIISTAKTMGLHPDIHDALQVPAAGRSDISEMSIGGFEPGQLAAQEDMDSQAAQHEAGASDNLALLNAGTPAVLWAKAADVVAQKALSAGDIFVVSGPLYSGPLKHAGTAGLAIPQFLFKGFYEPATASGGVYVVSNDSAGGWSYVSLADFKTQTGMTLFPGAPCCTVKTDPMERLH